MAVSPDLLLQRCDLPSLLRWHDAKAVTKSTDHRPKSNSRSISLGVNTFCPGFFCNMYTVHGLLIITGNRSHGVVPVGIFSWYNGLSINELKDVDSGRHTHCVQLLVQCQTGWNCREAFSAHGKSIGAMSATFMSEPWFGAILLSVVFLNLALTIVLFTYFLLPTTDSGATCVQCRIHPLSWSR